MGLIRGRGVTTVITLASTKCLVAIGWQVYSHRWVGIKPAAPPCTVQNRQLLAGIAVESEIFTSFLRQRHQRQIQRHCSSDCEWPTMTSNQRLARSRWLTSDVSRCPCDVTLTTPSTADSRITARQHLRIILVQRRAPYVNPAVLSCQLYDKNIPRCVLCTA